jgi:hypothetical protein
MREPLPPVAAVLSFIDRINHCDVEGLVALIAEDHELRILDEPPVVGRQANKDAWLGYMSRFPQYVIYPDRIAEREGAVAVLGRTTGSHLGLPDEREIELFVLWLAKIRDGRLTLWSIIEDSPDVRERWGVA